MNLSPDSRAARAENPDPDPTAVAWCSCRARHRTLGRRRTDRLRVALRDRDRGSETRSADRSLVSRLTEPGSTGRPAITRGFHPRSLAFLHVARRRVVALGSRRRQQSPSPRRSANQKQDRLPKSKLPTSPRPGRPYWSITRAASYDRRAIDRGRRGHSRHRRHTPASM